MIEDLILWLKTPIGEEIFLMFLLPLISSILILWGVSKLFKFKKDNFLTALWVGYLYVVISFLIRLINILFKLSDSQKPTVNIIAMIISNVILIFLIVKVYKANWWKTILTWFGIYYGRFMLTGIVMIIMMFSIPAFSESDSAPTAKVGMTDFNINEVGEEIGNNHFRVYRKDVVRPISTKYINLVSSVAFDTRTEGVTINFECNTQGGEHFDLKKYRGSSSFSCTEVCSKEKTTFNMKGLFNESIEYVTKSEIAELSPGKFSGTKVLYVERRKPIGVHVGLTLSGEENITLSCDVSIISERPLKTFKKSFTIDYIAKDIECKDYTESGNYAPGEVIIEFTQDVTKEQAESLLSSYNLPSDQIEFPEMFDFRVDFEGNEEGFVDFLEQHEFIKTGNPNIFEVRSFEYIKCEEAKRIFRSYPDISIDYIHCFERVEGIVKVLEGEEDKWICELKKNDIVINANLNKVGSIAN